MVYSARSRRRRWTREQLGAPAGVVELGQLAAAEAAGGEAAAAQLALDLLAADDELLARSGGVATGASGGPNGQAPRDPVASVSAGTTR